MRRSLPLLSCFALVSVGLSGCGSAGDGGPPRVPVTVTISHGGTPVEGAHVTFVPKGEGQAAYGVTGADGTTKLSTLGENDGAIPGEYQVTVKKTETEGPETDFEPAETGAMPANAEAMGAAQTRSLLPEKYSAIGTTDLEATVSESAENQIRFDLKG